MPICFFSTRPFCWLCVCLIATAGWGGPLADSCLADDADAQALSEEEQRQVQIAERFVGVLEKSPRRGTALDRVYGHHVEFGTLDDFIGQLRTRVEQSPDDGAGWMLMGLFESQRGQDANAIDAFQQAEKFRPEDPLASYYLGQSQLLLGQPEAAVQSFERAIQRKPQRADLLEIFQQLGRVHQRAQREDEALEVWTRLETLFPDDPRVQEQIAVTLVEEGKYDLALPRYEQLAKSVTDDYRQTMFRLEAAELKVRTAKRDAGIADLEQVLANLNPDSWLHREVRRRIEDIFLRSGDQDGLVKYYEKWIAGHAEDVDAMARVARFLASSARMPEAMQWMEQALKLAPRRFELRKAFIDQLVDDQRYADAIQQYQLLAQADPGNPDVLRDWGKLVLKDKTQPVEQRQAEATRIWNQIVASRPDDALTAAQAADLFRQANLHEQAIALYEKAVSLAPADPQYREYLGEYFHILKRPDDALATWKQIAEGPQHNAVNVARLAEVYQTFGYMDSAVEQIAEACHLEPKDFALQLRSADYHARAGLYDPALKSVDAAESLAANAEEQDAVIAQRIEVLQSARRLEDESDALAAQLAKAAMPAADDWHLLARYLEAERRWALASEAIDKALSIDAQSIPALTTAARIAESAGDLGRAAELNRKLANADRRSRGDHLMNVARIEAQLGRTDAALQAGRDLIVSAPGNTDHYEFYAQLCFQLGRMDDGLDTLRKAVRINPSEPSLILALGNALSQQFRTDEAIEVYWRAFEKTDEVEEKTALTEKLTALYLQVNQFDKLIERFERDRREEDQRRDLTICLAQAHSSAGDSGTARSELESLLSQETRDTNLLQQLSKLCESGGDFDGAIEYQRQLAAIAPGHETEHRLATLLQRAGESDQAAEIFLKLTRREEDPVRLIRSIDSLLNQGSFESVLAVVDPLLSEQRDDWELLYRQGVARALLDKPAEAQQSFQRIVAVNRPLDANGRAAEERYKRDLAKAKSESLRGLHANQPQRHSPLNMLQNSYQIKSACGLDVDRNYYGNSTPSVWTPDYYGVARMAAFGWLLRYEQEADSGEKQEQTVSFVDPIQERAEAPDARQAEIYDWLFIESLRGNYDSIFNTARRLAESGGKDEQRFFLQSLNLRTTNADSVRTSSNSQAKKEPLSDADLELMLRCYDRLNQQAEDEGQSNSSFAGAQIAYGSNGQMYVNINGSWVAVSGSVNGGRMFLSQVTEELELAGREEQAEQLIVSLIDDAKTVSDFLGAMNLILTRDEKHPNRDALRPLYDRWLAAAPGEIHATPSSSSRRGSRAASSINDPLSGSYSMLTNWIGLLGPDEENEQILGILNPALDLSIEVLKAQRAERSKLRRRTSGGSTNQRDTWSMRYQYGKENRSVAITYPTPGNYASTPQISLLRATYEVLQRNNVPEDLIANARARLKAASDDNRMYEQLMLAYVLWWAEQPEETVELLKLVAVQVSDDSQFQLELAQVQQTEGDLDGALELVDGIAPRDQKLLQQRELLALSLAERLGDVDRARQAAERLFGLRLSIEEQLGLATAMRRIGMLELADSIMARIQRQSGQQASSLTLLMVQYLSQGQVELAQQIAHRILRTTQSPLIGQGNMAYNPNRYSRSNNSGRDQALRILQQSGGLQPMIDRLEAQIEKSPESLRLYQQLIELYQTTNNREKLATTLSTAVAVRPDDVSLQYLLAKHCEQTGQPKEACDAYLRILKLKPRWITDDLYSIRRVFDQAQRTADLAKAFAAMDIKQIGQPYYLIDIVQNLMRDKEQVDLGIEILERTIEAFPNYRINIISNLNNNEQIWENDRVYALGKQLITPSEDDLTTSPWYGVNQIYSYGSDGRASSYFSHMLNSVTKTGRQDDLQKYLTEQVEQKPEWLGGQMMLALIEQKQGNKESARKKVTALVPTDKKDLEKIPQHA
ncbi:MAG: tetratricopeptide repeat protein, partial [Planctomycetaceae bacterium]